MKKKKDEVTIRSSAAEYLTYVASVGDQQDSIEMRYEDENIWLTQKMMATLYDVDVRTINEHIKKIYSDSELEEDSTIRNFRIVQTEGSRQVTRDTKHYNLQMIIAVGFKVNNERAVQFRKWANGIVKDYTIKGWVMDDERLKNGGSVLTVEYFDRLLEQIREIRLSERRFYQKITDIYATVLDYDRTAKTTKQFFAKVQNKMPERFFRMQVRSLLKLPRQRPKPNLKNIVSFRIGCSCLTLISTCWNWRRMRKSSSIAIKIFSLPRSSAWELGHQSGRKIAVDLFSIRRTDKVEAMAVLRQI